MSNEPFRTLVAASEQDVDVRGRALELFKASPIPDAERLQNLGLHTSRQTLARMLFFHEVYKRIVGVHGVVMEFGVRWGQDLALLQSLRGIYEPYNHTRKIIGFDTFEGFPSVHAADGAHEIIETGNYGVSEGYEHYLRELLANRERESPLSHMNKFDLVKGDVSQTLPAYLDEHPETVVAFAYFDMDLYEPTLAALEALRDRFVKGAVLGFDEIGPAHFPGETVALREALGLSNVRLQRLPIDAEPSFLIWGE
ncbi:crotonobetainyl-CoA--carnitine CoA-transferase [Solirubrobacter soli]|uniref:crotonobetainyl-CoA--carnitine CoA-transferase n=1 Tax=Solirubrobacter soli TaxID=363832 RepID=UPI00041CAFDB|nr:crotonobetainyl-CoA--carnitine CoA-transferase [Solirubrobacter soli]